MPYMDTKKASSDINIKREQRGFTLIELMVVIVIIAMLAAIAIPSYRAYITRNAEAEAKSQMLLLANQLERWRAKALTYEGFVPQDGYTNPATGTISIPTSNPRYVITIGQVNGGTFSTLASGQGNSWTMLAVPTNRVVGGHTIRLSSRGVRCEVIGSVVITDDDCGVGQESW